MFLFVYWILLSLLLAGNSFLPAINSAEEYRKEDIKRIKDEQHKKEEIELKHIMSKYIDNFEEMPPLYFNPKYVDQLIPRLEEKYERSLIYFAVIEDYEIYNFANIELLSSAFTNYYTAMKDEMLLLKGIINADDLKKEIDNFVLMIEESLMAYCNVDTDNMNIKKKKYYLIMKRKKFYMIKNMGKVNSHYLKKVMSRRVIHTISLPVVRNKQKRYIDII